MSDPRKDFVFRRDWKLLVAAVLALALVIGVIHCISRNCGVLGCSFDQGERMFVAFSINAEGSDQHKVVADVQPVDLDDLEVQLGQVRHIGIILDGNRRHARKRGLRRPMRNLSAWRREA